MGFSCNGISDIEPDSTTNITNKKKKKRTNKCNTASAYQVGRHNCSWGFPLSASVYTCVCSVLVYDVASNVIAKYRMKRKNKDIRY